MRNMTLPSFGQALGLLVRQKRQAQGLTQVQLAEDAFGSSAKTRRISELESGSVANPHPKTIDPIIATLGITIEELEICARKSSSRSDDDLDRAYREARNLIDAIARQFEHDRPTASLAELDAFLRAKAAEWAALRKRIASIEADDHAIEEFKQLAAAALANGSFSEVDRLLAQAEDEYQLNRTLSEVHKHAAIRIARGDSGLLQGDTVAALAHYTAAAEFYRPFDESLMAEVLRDLAGTVYETSRRSLNPLYAVGTSLLELLITLPAVRADPRTMAEAHYQLGLIYRNEYDDHASARRDVALVKAIEYSTLAAESPETAAIAYNAVTTTIGLANCLRDRGRANTNLPDFLKAIELLVIANEKYGTNDDCAVLMPHLYNSLGALYVGAEVLDGAQSIPDARTKALEAFQQAIVASEHSHNADTWGAAHFNVGKLLHRQATMDGGDPAEQAFLRLRAIVEITAAIETFPAALFPFRFADAQFELGRLFFRHAVALQDEQLSQAYQFRALQALEVAAGVSAERQPLHYAAIRSTQGAILTFHARRAETAIALSDLDQAINFYQEALHVYQDHDLASEAESCQEEIERTTRLRASAAKKRERG